MTHIRAQQGRKLFPAWDDAPQILAVRLVILNSYERKTPPLLF